MMLCDIKAARTRWRAADHAPMAQRGTHPHARHPRDSDAAPAQLCRMHPDMSRRLDGDTPRQMRAVIDAHIEIRPGKKSVRHRLPAGADLTHLIMDRGRPSAANLRFSSSSSDFPPGPAAPIFRVVRRRCA